MINYNYFEKVKYKNYQIRDNLNLNLLKTFNEFIEIISTSNLKYIVTGSFALSYLTKKCFRTWKDIDIIYIDAIHLYLKLFPQSKWRYQIFSGTRVRLYNILNDNFLELLRDDFDVYQKKLFIVNNKITFADKNYILEWKKQIGKNHKHIDEYIFYSENTN